MLKAIVILIALCPGVMGAGEIAAQCPVFNNSTLNVATKVNVSRVINKDLLPQLPIATSTMIRLHLA